MQSGAVVARQAHNLKAVGSNPTSCTQNLRGSKIGHAAGDRTYGMHRQLPRLCSKTDETFRTQSAKCLENRMKCWGLTPRKRLKC